MGFVRKGGGGDRSRSAAPAASQKPAGGGFQQEAGNAAVAEQVRGRSGAMDEAFESSLVGRNEPGQLVRLSDGKKGAPNRVTVHGVNASPDGVKALNDHAIQSGAKVSTFAYDDQFRRLGKSGADLAQQLEQELAADPKRKLIIDAHSMGSRLTLEAMRILAEKGVLTDKNIELNLIAPPLAGITGGGAEVGTNAARLDPLGLIGALKGGVRPGKDMGSNSPFQKGLDGMELPESVRTRIFTGGQDDVVDHQDPRFKAMADKLASPADQHHFPRATHDGVIGDAVSRLPKR